MVRRRSFVALALACVLATPLAAPLAAQRTGDQARLVISVSPAYVFGTSLWSIERQPILGIVGNPFDTLAISRKVSSTVGLAFAGAYFPNDHWGLGAEGFLLGLGFDDDCHPVALVSGDARTQAICEELDRASKAATAVVLSGNVLYRVNSRKTISPYVRVNGGLVFSNQSSIRTIGTDIRGAEPVDVDIYQDDHTSRVRLAGAVGLGIVTKVAPGYQIRWEVRDAIAGVDRVTAPTTVDGQVPPHSVTYKHLPSILIGLEVVLERRRGRRY